MFNLFIGCAFYGISEAQVARSYRLSTGSLTFLLPSNSVNELVASGDTIWAGTSRGLGITATAGTTWEHFGSVPPLKASSVASIAVRGPIVWVAHATSTDAGDESLPTGDGLFRSTDGGSTWTAFPQPVDVGTVDSTEYGVNWIATLKITTAVNNITYDIAIGPGTVWTANYAGMLRKSVDSGATWTRVVLPPDSRDSICPTDSLDFDLAPTGGRLGLRQNLNHRVFSVLVASDSSVWVGTAGGINRSTDGGKSWRRFSHQNQARSISGNFVVAIREQLKPGGRTIWAATVNAESPDETRGISWTDNEGATWQTALLGEFAHNIAFKDSIAYIATDNGLYRTSDGGDSWLRSGAVVDNIAHQRLAMTEVITVAVHGDTVWIGTPDGAAWTLDTPSSSFGSIWRIMRTAISVAPSVETYAYPLPFSPDDEVVRIHYAIPSTGVGNVTIRIYDFAMLPVRTLVAGVQRNPGTQVDEIWDGTTDDGRRASNGVYFYRLELDGGEPVWGKILVLQ